MKENQRRRKNNPLVTCATTKAKKNSDQSDLTIISDYSFTREEGERWGKEDLEASSNTRGGMESDAELEENVDDRYELQDKVAGNADADLDDCLDASNEDSTKRSA